MILKSVKKIKLITCFCLLSKVYSWKTEKIFQINNIMEAKYRKGHFIGVLKVIEKRII